MKHAAFLLLFSLCLFTCKHKESVNPIDDLPPETQTGQNTFGCLVNGRAWVPGAPFPVNRLTVDYYQGIMTIKANLKKDGRNQLIYICRDSLVASGKYLLNNSLYKKAQLHDFSTLCTYDTDSVNVGILEMTRVDTINGIFSGRFQFTIGVVGCDTIKVTSGRFDVRR